jgi:predicted RNA-binding Zn ribbon-like protein
MGTIWMNEALDALQLPLQLGGHTALDFVNTIVFRRQEGEIDYLPSYLYLLAWCEKNHLLTDTQSHRLQTAAQAHPDNADSALHVGLSTRDMLYTIFTTYLANRTLQALDLAPLNELLAQLMPYRRLEINGEVCVWGWQDDPEHLERLLLPILSAAADLLTSESLKQLRQCPNCGWLFLDTSRNHTRRWCSMDFCGSKMKSRRQYERIKSQVQSE